MDCSWISYNSSFFGVLVAFVNRFRTPGLELLHWLKGGNRCRVPSQLSPCVDQLMSLIATSPVRTALEAHSVQRGASEHVSWREVKHTVSWVHRFAEFFTTASTWRPCSDGQICAGPEGANTLFTIPLCFDFQGGAQEDVGSQRAMGSSVTLCG